MVEQKDLLAREVDDELRREQLLKLWEQYGTYVIAAAALIIVGVGGVKYYQHRARLAAEAAGARFVAATHQVAESKAAEARKELEDLAAHGPTGYAALARLRLAASHAAAGKPAEAAAEFEAVADDGTVDALLRDYARLQAAMLRLDTASWTDMQNRLNDLAAEQSAWRYSARELRGRAAYKAGKTEEARQEFQRLIDDRTTPRGIADRALIMMGMIAQAEVAKSPTQPVDKAEEPQAKSDEKAPEPKGKGKADAKKPR